MNAMVGVWGIDYVDRSDFRATFKQEIVLPINQYFQSKVCESGLLQKYNIRIIKCPVSVLKILQKG